MNISFVWMVAALAGPVAQTSPFSAKAPDPNARGPMWFCAEENVNLPDMWQGSDLRCDFPIRNDGDVDLNLTIRPG